MKEIIERYLVLNEEEIEISKRFSEEDFVRVMVAITKSRNYIMKKSREAPDLFEFRGFIFSEKENEKKILENISTTPVVFIDKVLENEIRIIKNGNNFAISYQTENVKFEGVNYLKDDKRNILIEKHIKKENLSKELTLNIGDMFNSAIASDIIQTKIGITNKKSPNIMSIIKVKIK